MGTPCRLSEGHLAASSRLPGDEAVPVSRVHAHPLQRRGRGDLPGQGGEHLQFQLLDVCWLYAFLGCLGELLYAWWIYFFVFGSHLQACGCDLLHLSLLWLASHALCHHETVEIVDGHLAGFPLHLEVRSYLLHAVDHIGSVEPPLALSFLGLIFELVSLLDFAFHKGLSLLQVYCLPYEAVRVQTRPRWLFLDDRYAVGGDLTGSHRCAAVPDIHAYVSMAFTAYH